MKSASIIKWNVLKSTQDETSYTVCRDDDEMVTNGEWVVVAVFDYLEDARRVRDDFAIIASFYDNRPVTKAAGEQITAERSLLHDPSFMRHEISQMLVSAYGVPADLIDNTITTTATNYNPTKLTYKTLVEAAKLLKKKEYLKALDTADELSSDKIAEGLKFLGIDPGDDPIATLRSLYE